MLQLSRYQWIVLFAAWLGWGFDIFDNVLFNYVAPNCVPTLLGLTIGSPEAKAATLLWTGILSSVLLLGWAVGGIVFGKVADRIGRTKTLLITMLLYALGTAACAFAPNMGVLVLCRIVASLGIGGEWAAGASMVAEVMPERSRVEAGVLLNTAASAGPFLASFLNFQIAGVLLPESPETSWRFVFLFGLIPAAVAVIVRLFVKEPERWQKVAENVDPARIRELFQLPNRAATISGLAIATIALITLTSCLAFMPAIASGLASSVALERGLNLAATQSLIEQWKAIATNSCSIGSLIGTLLTVPAAKYLGRKIMFSIYFVLSSLTILIDFGLPLSPETRLYFYFFIGLTVAGVFGSFTYYLPELFPTRLRATGAGFCYNAGRVFAAIGPLLIGYLASQGTNTLSTAIDTLFWVGFIPLLGIAFMPWAIETKGLVLAD
ncbi:MFS transporter [Argonema antarcticum]|uniref:MFS transporter n=1 Tax=Argonema antarcticum TaxID=2942763 RepID=UPI002011A6DC|nr:MFS transporter [Argonema antarcticum]MCL1470684.1 MFS transporter [Argonema antarcticum A004/B2]